jgi:hypothetical protein
MTKDAGQRRSWGVFATPSFFAPELDGQDPQLIPVFGHGAPCHLDIFLDQEVGNFVVAERLGRIFRIDQLADPVSDAFRGYRVASVWPRQC